MNSRLDNNSIKSRGEFRFFGNKPIFLSNYPYLYACFPQGYAEDRRERTKVNWYNWHYIPLLSCFCQNHLSHRNHLSSWSKHFKGLASEVGLRLTTNWYKTTSTQWSKPRRTRIAISLFIQHKAPDSTQTRTRWKFICAYDNTWTKLNCTIASGYERLRWIFIGYGFRINAPEMRSHYSVYGIARCNN